MISRLVSQLAALIEHSTNKCVVTSLQSNRELPLVELTSAMSVPRLRRQNRRGRRRNNKRRNNNGNTIPREPQATIMRLPTIFPDVTLSTLTYRETIQMTDVNGTGAYVMSLNSINEPNSTSTGHQALGHDQWATFYGRYEVTSSRIRVAVAVNGVDLSVRFTVYPSIFVLPAGNPDEAAEQPYAQSVNIGLTSRTTTTANNTMSVAKLEGRNTSSTSYTAAFNANPNFQRFWILYLDALGNDPLDSIADVTCDIIIDYRCRFFRRRSLLTS